ncbi:MAG: CYTH domain-containing protein [Lachnospiraceae bacterium]|nr:CYTH domain-containing protein [Lachnospiraceae bacterium]
MEIERKFLLKEVPDNLDTYPCLFIEQGYLCRNPVIRIRHQNDEYILTYKGKGHMVRDEYDLPLGKEGYEQLLPKIDGRLITKRRYLIPLKDLDNSYEDSNLTVEVDVFEGHMAGTILAEIEFDDIEDALNFVMPECFIEDVTIDPAYHNSNMSLIS